MMAASMRASAGTTASALNMAIEIALVGPLINCLLEANKAPTAVMTMAVYKPNWTGMPKMLA